MDSRFQNWRFLVALFTGSQFLEFMAWGHLQAFTPLYLRGELGVSEGDVPRWTGLLAASSLFVAVPLAPFWGVLADRYSRKAVILRSLYVETVAFGLLALAGSPEHVLAVRLLLGLTFGNVALVLATVSLASPDRRVGTAIGMVQMAMPLASSVGPIVGSFLIGIVGLRGMFAFDSACTLLGALLITFLFREPPRRGSTGTIRSRLKIVVRHVVTSPSLRWNFLAWFFIWSAMGAADPFVPLLIARLYNGPDLPLAIGTVLGIYGLVMGLSTPIAGRLADSLNPYTLLLATTSVLSLSLLGMSFAPDISILTALVLARSLPQAATSPFLYSHLARHTPKEHRAAIMAFTPLPRNLAMLVGPLGASFASSLGVESVFRMAAILFALALVTVVLMARAASQDPPHAVR